LSLFSDMDATVSSWRATLSLSHRRLAEPLSVMALA
jgi:hypothetical protein